MGRVALLLFAVCFLVAVPLFLYSQSPTSEVTITLRCSGPADVTGSTTVNVSVNGVPRGPETLYCSGGPPMATPNADCASCHGLPSPYAPGRAYAKSIPLADGEAVTYWEVTTKVGPHDGTQKACVAGVGDSIPAQSLCRNDKYGAGVHID